MECGLYTVADKSYNQWHGNVECTVNCWNIMICMWDLWLKSALACLQGPIPKSS